MVGFVHVKMLLVRKTENRILSSMGGNTNKNAKEAKVGMCWISRLSPSVRSLLLQVFLGKLSLEHFLISPKSVELSCQHIFSST